MAGPLKLFDLFAASLQSVLERWPESVRPEPGLSFNFSSVTISPWLDALNLGVRVSEVRTSARPDRVAVQARLRIENAASGHPEGFPFALASMPDVLFRIPDMPASAYAELFASLADDGGEFVIERLPLEIRLPAGLLTPHPSVNEAVPSVTTGAFSAGTLDALQVVLRRDEESSVLVHARIHCNAAGEVTIRTAVPITIGKCSLSGLPCLAVHGLELIPSTARAPDEIAWLRHEVTPWAPSLVGPIEGCFAVRSVELDHTAEPLKGAYDWLNGHSGAENPALDSDTTVTVVGPDRALTPEDRAAEPSAEFVLGDLVVPFWSPWVVPVPRHITIGLRRRIVDARSPTQVFAFDKAPVRAYFSREPLTAFIVEALFYRSQPAALAAENFGLTLDASLVFGANERDRTHSGSQALQIAVEEQWTLSAGYRRDWDPVHNLPAAGGLFDSVLHWTIASFTVDIVAIRLGYSLGRGITENAPFKDSVEATFDLFISSSAPNPNAVIQLKSLDGGAVGIIFEGIGWRLGAFQMKGASSPAGVVLLFANRFGLIIQELGLTAEEGASYLCISGGVLLEIPSGFTGALTFQRLRIRVAGDTGTPPVKLDGFFLWLKTTGFDLQVGGYYKEITDGTSQIKEFGLTGALAIGIGAVDFRFGLDLIAGSLRSPAEQFEYLMIQMFFRGSIPICLFELRGVRVLFARNMQPRLGPVDPAAQSLRYFNWYRASNPLTVPGDRRLASWKPANDAWALGLGCNGSFAKMGAAIELGVFVLYITGPDEQGLLIVVEVMLLSSPKPVGYLAVEWDIKNGRFSGVLGVELTVGNFVENAPEFLNSIAKLTGTLFFSNDPPTFAIGRLADERTWLQYRLDIDLFVRAFMVFGACLEIVDGGPRGCALVIRIEGQINGGIVAVRYNAGMGFVLASFSTGSVDYSLVIWIEAGLRIILFGFLRFGISAHAELRVVGASPTRGELMLTVRLETPWFLPDVTWTLEHEWGQVRVAELATSTQPLLAAGATEGGSEQRRAMHVERALPGAGWNGEGTAPVFSIADLRAGGSTESARLARFSAATDVAPIATDATLAVGFSVSVNDLIGFGTGVEASLGDQKSGDLTLTYDLVGVAVRRRSRFGEDQAWYTVDARRELTADFSDPNGVTLSGAILAAELTMLWDLDVRVAGGAATRQLLINAATPFEFATSDPETDDRIVAGDPAWPCCHGRKPSYDLHEVVFREEALGPAAPGSRVFTRSTSRLYLLSSAVVRPASLPGLPAGARVAAIRPLGPGVLWRADLSEDAAFCFVRLAVGRTSPFRLVAYDGEGKVVGMRAIPGAPAFQTVAMPGTGPIRRLELQVLGGPGNGEPMFALRAAVAPAGRSEVEVDRVAYVSLREYLDSLRKRVACDDGSDQFQDAYSGKGKLFLLPNHDYEVAVTTRVTAEHPSRPAEAVETTEYLYCRTKGLPGLNAVGRIGEELQPYVRSAYAGGRGLLYREEPVAMQLSENYSVALPLSKRPAGTSLERTLLVRMQLLVEPSVAIDAGTVRTATDEDWIVANRGTTQPLFPWVWTTAVSVGSTMAAAMTSIDPYRIRLAGLTQRPGAPCALPDPRDVTGTVLLAPPQGEPDPRQPGRELWPAGAVLAAGVRLEHSGYVDRVSFEPADATAFTYGRDGATSSLLFALSGWSVSSGRLTAPGGAARAFAIFGETDWNHVVVQSDIVTTGGSAGIGVGVPAGSGPPAAGLFAMIEPTGGGRRLVIRRRTTAAEWTEVADAPLPPAGPSPDTLTVTAFDDRLRAAVGEVAVEADRVTARDGRLALVAHGGAAFGSLRVRGVSMYAFPVHTSRFMSFAQHIESWKGVLATAAPGLLGASATSTVPTLWAATAPAVVAAMAPGVDDAESRDAVFRQWVEALTLPLAEEVLACQLTRWVENGATTMLVLESPEPIDCSLEVAVTLERRVKVPSHPWDGALDLAESWRLRAGLPQARRHAGGLAGLIEARERMAGARQQLLSDEGASVQQVEPVAHGSAIVDAVSYESGLRLELGAGAAASGDRAALANALIVERLTDDSAGVRARVHRVAPVQGGNAPAQRLELSAAQTLSNGGNDGGLVPWKLLERLGVGAVVAFDPVGGIIIDWWQPSYRWDDVPVRTLQDGSRCRTLLIAEGTSGAEALPAGSYRLTLRIDRARWQTTEPPDNNNRYRSESTLPLAWS